MMWTHSAILSLAYSISESWNQLQGASERYIQLKPDDEFGYFDLAVAYGALERGDEAVEAYRKALDLKPDSLEAAENLEWLYLDANCRAFALQIGPIPKLKFARASTSNSVRRS